MFTPTLSKYSVDDLAVLLKQKLQHIEELELTFKDREVRDLTKTMLHLDSIALQLDSLLLEVLATDLPEPVMNAKKRVLRLKSIVAHRSMQRSS